MNTVLQFLLVAVGMTPFATYLTRSLARRNRRLHEQLLPRAVAQLDVIRDGRLWTGSELIIVKVLNLGELSYYFGGGELLCKSAREAWCRIPFSYSPRDVALGALEPLPIDTAKSLLAEHPIEYAKHFGMPATA